jgi:hypothetical protein
MADLSAATYTTPLRAVVILPYKPRDILELELKKNQKLDLLEPKREWWYIARFRNGQQGWVPAKHIRILPQLDDYILGKLFLEWYEKKEVAFGEEKKVEMDSEEAQAPGMRRGEKLGKETFPFPPPEIDVCVKVVCKIRKRDKGLGACVHDMERFLKAGFGDVYGAKCLWVESLVWHPDRVGRRCKAEFMSEGNKAAAEMYVILGELIEEARKKEGGE